jgi:hypothetical protein
MCQGRSLGAVVGWSPIKSFGCLPGAQSGRGARSARQSVGDFLSYMIVHALKKLPAIFVA